MNRAIGVFFWFKWRWLGFNDLRPSPFDENIDHILSTSEVLERVSKLLCRYNFRFVVWYKNIFKKVLD